jgi:hypothetical protein
MYVRTVRRRQSPSVEFHRHQISKNALLVANSIAMAVCKGIIQILFRQPVFVFKHVEPANEVPIGYHIPHGAIFIELSCFDRPNQVFAKSKNVESKVNGKEFVDNGQDSRFFGSVAIVRSAGL